LPSALRGHELKVRLAGINDVAAISSIAFDCHLREGADTAEGFLLQDFGADGYLKLLETAACTLVCENGAGRTVGFLFALPFAGTLEAQALGVNETKAVVVGQVGIYSEHRRRGLGRRLYEELFAQLGGRTVVATVMTAPVENAASIAFHEALGFHEVCELGAGATRERLFVHPAA
jgi:ribosomal protein S18 acetylase RimI-like enzyme